MSVLVIVQGTPRAEKAAKLKEYQDAALPLIQKYGGQPIARGKGVKSLAGHHEWSVAVIIRFPDLEAVNSWYNDAEYQKVIPLRTEAYADLEINVFQE
jgi:uncharacterized protein (DUF1330 family)